MSSLLMMNKLNSLKSLISKCPKRTASLAYSSASLCLWIWERMAQNCIFSLVIITSFLILLLIDLSSKLKESVDRFSKAWSIQLAHSSNIYIFW